MAGRLYLKDMQPLVFTDIENLSKKNKVANISKKLLSKYKGLHCFFRETDYDHHDVYFLSEITGVSLDIGQEGLKAVAEFSERGVFHDEADDTYYQLVKNRIAKENLDKLLKKKPQKFIPSSGARTYHTKPEVELVPIKQREQEAICDEIFVISDGKYFLKL